LDFAIFQVIDPDFHAWHRWTLREAALHLDGWHENCGRTKLGPILLRNRKENALCPYRRCAEDQTPNYTSVLDRSMKLLKEGWTWTVGKRSSGYFAEITHEGCIAEIVDAPSASRAFVAACIEANLHYSAVPTAKP